MTAGAGQPCEWTYEDICSSCREMVLEMDERRWLLGDSALAIETQYGQHTLADFSRDIGANQSTVRGYKRVSQFYPQAFRGNLFESNPNLTFTYYRDALRLGDFDAAVAWLAEVSSNGYTADEAARKLTERLGRQTRESYEGEITSRVLGRDCTQITILVDQTVEWEKGQVVSIRIK